MKNLAIVMLVDIRPVNKIEPGYVRIAPPS